MKFLELGRRFIIILLSIINNQLTATEGDVVHKQNLCYSILHFNIIRHHSNFNI